METVAIDESYMAQGEWDGLADVSRAARFAAALEACGVSQAALMKKLDVSYTTVNRWKQGHTPISWARWVSICGILGIPTKWKAGDVVPDAPRPARKPRSH